MISCEEAAVLCTKKQYRALPFSGRVRLLGHLMFCSCCKGFTKKNNRLTQLCQKANLQVLSEAEKAQLQNALTEMLQHKRP